MPELRDRAAIRAILERDRAWAVYALGDLAPGFFEHCRWLRPESGAPALALLYRAFKIPVLFTLGAPEALAALLEEISGEPVLYLHVRPEILPVLAARYGFPMRKQMWRMVLEPSAFHPVPSAGAVRLTAADLDALRRLYADGDATGEAPDFFSPSMLEQGVFQGIREGEDLIAVAGTHLVAPEVGVGAVGCVYTRRDRRGRGLATRVTSVVVSELLRLGIPTVALNVEQRNETAVRVYERLGFFRYCPYTEGLASRRQSS